MITFGSNHLGLQSLLSFEWNLFPTAEILSWILCSMGLASSKQWRWVEAAVTVVPHMQDVRSPRRASLLPSRVSWQMRNECKEVNYVVIVKFLLPGLQCLAFYCCGNSCFRKCYITTSRVLLKTKCLGIPE